LFKLLIVMIHEGRVGVDFLRSERRGSDEGEMRLARPKVSAMHRGYIHARLT